RQEGAELIDKAYAGRVREPAERHRADPSEAKRQPEKEAGDCPDLARYEIEGIDDDRRGGRGQRHPDDDAEDRGPRKIDVPQDEGDGDAPEDRSPDHRLPPDAVAERAADQGAGCDGGEENEQIDLRLPDR